MADYFETGVFYGEAAWHNLGTTLDSADERRYSVVGTMEAADMDWSVSKLPLAIASSPDVPEAIRGAGIADRYAIVRDSDYSVLGTVGERYEPLQNHQMFSWFQPFLDTKEIAFETAGSLKGGAVTWVLARLDRGDIDLSGDIIRKYLLLSSSHDGSLATSVGFCPIRTVCWNTLQASLKCSASKLLKVRHTVSQTDSLSAIRDTINLADQEFEATAEQYRRLMACGISSGDLRRYVKLVLELPEEDAAISTRSRNMVDRIIQLAVAGKGQDGSLTAWAGYQGVTEWLSNERGKDDSKRLANLWFGPSAATNRRAFELALQLSA